MKISRWIYVPLICGVSYALLMLVFDLLLGQPINFELFLFRLVGFALFGFVVQYLSDRKAKRISGEKDQKVFDVNQQRNLVVLLDYQKSFDLCRQAILSLKQSKVENEDFENGTITAKTGMNWDSWGEKIEVKLKKINENLTEVEIFTRPLLRSTLANSGRSWRITEDLTNFLKRKDAELNQKVLAESAEILSEVYVKPFEKEKIRK